MHVRVCGLVSTKCSSAGEISENLSGQEEGESIVYYVIKYRITSYHILCCHIGAVLLRLLAFLDRFLFLNPHGPAHLKDSEE